MTLNIQYVETVVTPRESGVTALFHQIRDTEGYTTTVTIEQGACFVKIARADNLIWQGGPLDEKEVMLPSRENFMAKGVLIEGRAVGGRVWTPCETAEQFEYALRRILPPAYVDEHTLDCA